MLFNFSSINFGKGYKGQNGWDKIYPEYGFTAHKGYGTAKHIAAIKQYGPCPLHRKSFITHFV